MKVDDYPALAFHRRANGSWCMQNLFVVFSQILEEGSRESAATDAADAADAAVEDDEFVMGDTMAFAV